MEFKKNTLQVILEVTTAVAMTRTGLIHELHIQLLRLLFRFISVLSTGKRNHQITSHN
jgi:hypothetical protein